MTEQIYIDGRLMQLEGAKAAVQLIYQSPILTDFQAIVSNRTTQVQLPATDSNLKAIGYTGTQAVSDYAYKRHTVIYKRDGVQLLNGNAVLLSINKGSIVMCFIWGNVTAMETLFEKNLQELTLTPAYCRYPAADLYYTMNRMNYGGGRHGVGICVKDVLEAIEADCGVSGLTSLSDAGGGREYVLALTTRNGDLRTKELQGASYGVFTARTWEVEYQFDITTLVGDGQSDPHGYLNEYGIMDVTNVNELRLHIVGSFDKDQVAAIGSIEYDVMKLCFDAGNGWDYTNGITISTPTRNTPTSTVWHYECNFDQVIDVSGYERVCIAITKDIVVHTAKLSNINMTYDVLIPDPSEAEDVIFGTGKEAFPVALNLPDMTCGEFIRQMLWIQGKFAYSLDGRTIQLVSFNQMYANKARAKDWTLKVDMARNRPEEFKTTLQDTAQHNYFRWAEADDYDNTQYEGELVTEDETIELEREYCKSKFALAPGNRIPVWSNNDGEWDYDGDGMPVRLLMGKPALLAKATLYAGYNDNLRWSWLLENRYAPYARLIRKPETMKVKVILNTYDLYTLDLTVPVYLQQTGHYYLIRTLTVKDGEQAEAELIKL